MIKPALDRSQCLPQQGAHVRLESVAITKNVKPFSTINICLLTVIIIVVNLKDCSLTFLPKLWVKKVDQAFCLLDKCCQWRQTQKRPQKWSIACNFSIFQHCCFSGLTQLSSCNCFFCHLLSRMKASLFSGQKAIEQGKRKPGLVKEVTRLSSLLNTATSLGTLHPYWFTKRWTLSMGTSYLPS